MTLLREVFLIQQYQKKSHVVLKPQLSGPHCQHELWVFQKAKHLNGVYGL